MEICEGGSVLLVDERWDEKLEKTLLKYFQRFPLDRISSFYLWNGDDDWLHKSYVNKIENNNDFFSVTREEIEGTEKKTI